MYFNYLDIQNLNLKLSQREEILYYLEIITEAIDAGFSELDPKNLLKSFFRRINNNLIIKNRTLNLDLFNGIYIIGAGKFSFQIATEIKKLLGKYFSKGIINTIANNNINITESGNIDIFYGGHPFPNQKTIEGTNKQLELLQSLIENDLVFVVITGGASSLFEKQVEGISLQDLVITYKLLVNSGLSISKINTIRKQISLVKGGGLNKFTKARIIGLYVSDVPGDNISDIGSGPSVRNTSNIEDCYNYLLESNLIDKLPDSVKKIINNKQKSANLRKNIEKTKENIENYLLGSNYSFLKAIQDVFNKYNIQNSICSTKFSGEAKEIGKYIFNYSNYPYTSLPYCLMWGGESTVIISSSSEKIGIGGRNQEVILSFFIETLEKFDKIHQNFIFISFGTDGKDGNSENAGGYLINQLSYSSSVSIEQLKKGLADHNSANTLPKENIIRTGLTDTNVSDIILLMIY